MSLLKAFIPLTKVDDEKRMVWGYASTDALDSHGEIVARAAIEKALDDYMKFANIREMHQLSAVGVAKEASIDEKGLFIGVHVVDEIAWGKVKAGVYKGFSIGGKCLAKTGKTIDELTLNEISLVDRPANPECTFTTWKADGAVAKADGSTEEVTLDLSAVRSTSTATETVAKSEPKPAESDAQIAKGFWNLQSLIEALQTLRGVVNSASYEAQNGEHSPEMVGELRDVLTGLAAAAQKYLGEEVAAMLAPPSTGVIALAQEGGEIAKAGRRFSGDTKAAIKAAHDALKAADKALSELGYDADDEEEGGEVEASKAASAPLAKADVEPVFDAETTELVQKAALPGVTEGAHARDVVKAALGALAKAQARVTELEALPAPSKGVLKAVTKGSDASEGQGSTDNEVAPVKKADGSVDSLATLIKGIHLGQPVPASHARA